MHQVEDALELLVYDSVQERPSLECTNYMSKAAGRARPDFRTFVSGERKKPSSKEQQTIFREQQPDEAFSLISLQWITGSNIIPRKLLWGTKL